MKELTPEKLIELRSTKGYSQQEVADLVGVSQRSYSMWERGETKPKHQSLVKLLEVLEVSDNLINKFKKEDGIPLIPIEAMAGQPVGPLQVIIEDIQDSYFVPDFKGADFMIKVKGSSMYPKYNSGDIVACKKLCLADVFFQWNKVYVLDTEQGALIKRIRKGKDENHILVVSDNEKYEPFELHRSKLNDIALVIGVIRLE